MVLEQNINCEFKYLTTKLDKSYRLCDTPSVHFTVQPPGQNNEWENEGEFSRIWLWQFFS